METDINAAETKQAQLKLLLKQLNRVAVAFSGGIDSAFLLKTASEVLRGNATAITVESPLFPKREASEAAEFCRNEGVRRETVSLTEEDFSVFAGNPPERCYLCKRLMFEKIRTVAAALDLGTVCEGTNADDENDYRPGLKALAEAGIRSPLLECGLTTDSPKTKSVSWRGGREWRSGIKRHRRVQPPAFRMERRLPLKNCG